MWLRCGLILGFFYLAQTIGFCEQADLKTVKVVSRDELIRAVQNAQPGTRILIAAGEYRGGLDFRFLRGTEAEPIVIAALDSENPPEIIGGNSGIHLVAASYVQLRNLVIRGATGNGLNLDDGGDAKQTSNHIVLQGLRVHNVGPKGNRDGIKLSGIDHFQVNDCVVTRWGDGGSAIDMVGCHNGVIQRCQFRHRGDIFGNGVQAKGGSENVTIRRCRFNDAGGRAINLGGSTGRDYFRPSNANFEARNITVEDCTFVGSMAPIAFVGVDGALVQHNTIYRPARWVIRILQESKGADFVPCRNGVFRRNLIAFQSSEVRSVVNVGGGTSPETFKFEQNQWYCIDNPTRSDRLGLPVKEVSGVYGIAPDWMDAKSDDFRQTPQSRTRKAGVRE